MAKSVFYSFEYQPDNWRVQQVINMGAVSGGAAFTAQDWESVRRNTDSAIERWIHEQMLYTKAVIVLVGEHTYDSRWVRYEITKAWEDRRPLLGVRIHGLEDSRGLTSRPGPDPFAQIGLQGGGTIADYVTLIDPTGYNSKMTHRTIREGLEDWVGRYAFVR